MSRPLTLSKAAKLGKQLVKLVVKGYHPSCIVEGELFRQFCAESELPTANKEDSVINPSSATVCKGSRRGEKAATKRISEFHDGKWQMSMTDESCTGLTTHFIDENSGMKSYLLDCFSHNEWHTTESIADELQQVVTEWGIQDKNCTGVSDNTASVTAPVHAYACVHNPCFTKLSHASWHTVSE